MRNNDDDIKIFRPQKTEDWASSDLSSLAGIMDKNRANGNSAKAAILGERLADLKPADVCPDEAPSLSEQALLQVRSLTVFAAQLSLTKYLPFTILSTQAVNAMYARLEASEPAFFASVADGSSFSFYYLCVRKNEPVAEIGRNFAMLCDDDDNESLKQLGMKVFEDVEEKVVSLIEEFEFEK